MTLLQVTFTKTINFVHLYDSYPWKVLHIYLYLIYMQWLFDAVVPLSLQGSSGGVHAADADRMEEERGAGGQGAAPGRQGEGLPGPFRPQRKEGKFSAVRVGY